MANVVAPRINMPAPVYSAARQLAKRRDLSYAQLVRAWIRKTAEDEGIPIDETADRERVPA
jgi:antitoxin component of RelBE/YafQ-DinJ toxin-antitoxin module